jgi:hypothetical protein
MLPVVNVQKQIEKLQQDRDACRRAIVGLGPAPAPVAAEPGLEESKPDGADATEAWQHVEPEASESHHASWHPSTPQPTGRLPGSASEQEVAEWVAGSLGRVCH